MDSYSTGSSAPPGCLRRAPQATVMITHTLRKCAMFRDLPPDTLSTIAEGCEILSVARGAYLFHDGKPAAGFFIVHSGSINLHRVTADGREQVIRVFYPGESLGEIALAEGATFPAAASALEDSKVILIRRSFFRTQIHGDPDLALRILASMSLHLKFLIETIEDLKLKHAESRLAQWLLRNVDPNPKSPPSRTVTLPITKRLLASQLGITSETFSRVLARFRAEHIITVQGKVIEIHDPDALSRYTDL